MSGFLTHQARLTLLALKCKEISMFLAMVTFLCFAVAVNLFSWVLPAGFTSFGLGGEVVQDSLQP